MQALLDVNSNVPSEVISYVGSNLKGEVSENSFVYDHDAESVWEACGLDKSDAEGMSKHLNKYMESLPEDERMRSKAVEYLMNSGNPKWMRILTIMGLTAMQDGPSTPDDLAKLIADALKRRMRKGDQDED